MATQDTSEIKNKIISIIKKRGPCLPVHIAKETDQSILFASAFLSELLSEKKIILSNMKVGSSPLYLLPDQKPQLENFAQHLKSKEKEAYSLLKEKEILKDAEQEPAIRVALRAIKDFAVPFEKNNEIYWKYFLAKEEKLNDSKNEPEKEAEKIEVQKEQIVKEIPEEQESKKEDERIEEKEIRESIIKAEQPQKQSATVKKTTTAKKAAPRTSKKQEEKFLEKVKEFLGKSSISIINIESLGRTDLSLRIKVNEEEQLLVGYNKKRVDEKDIIKASKKAKELGLKYSIISLGELPKKVSDLIEALENIKEIEKIE